MIDEELELSQNTTAAEGEATLDAKTFDLAAWISGVKPVRRATTIFARGDLAADLDIIKEEIQRAKIARDYKAVASLQEKAAPIVAALKESALDVVVEGWSPERIVEFHKAMKEAGADEETAGVEQVVAQIVEPAGFTREMFDMLRAVSGQQANAIVGIVTAANTAPVDASVPF